MFIQRVENTVEGLLWQGVFLLCRLNSSVIHILIPGTQESHAIVYMLHIRHIVYHTSCVIICNLCITTYDSLKSVLPWAFSNRSKVNEIVKGMPCFLLLLFYECHVFYHRVFITINSWLILFHLDPHIPSLPQSYFDENASHHSISSVNI